MAIVWMPTAGGITIETGNLADSAVTNPKIAANAVSTSKIENGAVTASKLASGIINGTTLANDSVGTNHIVNDAVETSKIDDGAVTNPKIANNAVTGGKIGSGQIGTSHIDSLAVTKAKIANNAIDTAKIENDAVTGDKIADEHVDTNHIADGAITSSKLDIGAIENLAIEDNSVSTSKVQDGAITGDKIDNGAVGASKFAIPQTVISGSLYIDPDGSREVIAYAQNVYLPDAEIGLEFDISNIDTNPFATDRYIYVQSGDQLLYNSTYGDSSSFHLLAGRRVIAKCREAGKWQLELGYLPNRMVNISNSSGGNRMIGHILQEGVPNTAFRLSFEGYIVNDNGAAAGEFTQLTFREVDPDTDANIADLGAIVANPVSNSIGVTMSGKSAVIGQFVGLKKFAITISSPTNATMSVQQFVGKYAQMELERIENYA